MRHRKIAIIAAAAVIAAAITFTVWRINNPSYGTIANNCAHALKEHLPSSKAEKPAACDGLKDDDYMALFMNQSMSDNGWLDENGDVDTGKVLEGTSQP
jgi:hypothetical protein